MSQARGKDRGKSTGDQELECRADIADNVPDGVVVAVYCDDDRGATRYSRKQRPDWDRLLDDLRAGKLDMLTSWEHSRTNRDLEVYVALRKICRETGTLWRYDGRTYNLNDDTDASQTAQDAVDAEKEGGRIRKRVLRGVRSRAAAGRPHGKFLYGYQREFDSETGAYLRTVPHPEHGPIVQEVFRRYAAGEGVGTIATDLTRRGVPTPQSAAVWRPQTLHNMLRNPGHRGHRASNAGHATIEGAWPALIDDATWWRVQARLNDPSRPVKLHSTVKHLLSGLPACGICGGTVVHNPGYSPKHNRAYPTYVCRDRHCVGRSAAGVEHDVLGFVFGMWEDEQRLKRASGNEAEVATLEDELAALAARLEMWQNSSGDEGVSPASVAAAERKLGPQIRAIEKQLDLLRAQSQLPHVDGPLGEAWDSLSLAVQRQVIAASVTIRILPAGKGRRYSSDSVQITPRW